MSFSDALGDRQFVSQYSIEDIGLVVHKSGAVADADANTVMVSMTNLDDTVTVFNRAATREEVGTYSITLASTETAAPGIYKTTWTYALDGVPQTFVGLIEVGEANSAYDALLPEYKAVVEAVWLRFADLFDSPYGGPHLQVYFQSRFGRGRMAQLLRTALGNLNMQNGTPPYSMDAGGRLFPFAKWGGLLEKALYIEAIKHLIRSYTEQPDPQGTVAIARMDRRDYMTRWQTVLSLETEEYKENLDDFKVDHMGLGKFRVLVSGGVYGNYGPSGAPLSAAARPRYWMRYV